MKSVKGMGQDSVKEADPTSVDRADDSLARTQQHRHTVRSHYRKSWRSFPLARIDDDSV